LKTNVVSKEDCSFGEMVELCKACRSVGAYIDSPRTPARQCGAQNQSLALHG
jgi:hypothetical protein